MTRDRAPSPAEAALEGEALRARAIGTSSPFLLTELDEQRRVLFVSPNYERITGMAPETLLQSDWTLFLHPNDAPLVEEAIARAARNSCAHALARGRRAGDGWLWYDCFFVSFRSASDEPRMLAVSRDVTEVRAHWERFRLIGETSLDLVSELTPDGVVLYASGSHENVLGFHPKQLVGSRVLDFLHPEDAERVAAAMQAGPDERMRGRFRVRDGEGTWRWIDCTATVYDAEGERRILGVSREVSDSVALEQALRESQERTQLLVTQQEDEREAERARIAREIHDELGQGLTGLRLQLGARPERGEGNPSQTEAMLAQIDHLLEAVRRIGARMLPPSLEQFGLVAAIESQARSLADAAGWKLRTELASNETGLDTRQQSAVFRVAQEALTNVARHAGASEVTVRLEILEDRLELMVRDDGRGIPAECVQSPRSSGIGGMRARAAILGATLSIEGVAQEGTKVRLGMPRRRSTDSPEEPA